jgi:hypothetical protein
MATKPLSETHPALAAEWHPTLNGDLVPDKVSAGSHRQVWWLGECGHKWEAEIASRAFGRGCGYCSGNKVLKGFNDLESQFPKIAQEWHPTLNLPLLPNQVTAKSTRKVWWLGKCGHEWQAAIGNRVNNHTECGYCSGNIVLKGFNDFETVNPEVAVEWHPTKNGTLTPDKVTPGSGKKVWWLGKCGHEWNSEIKQRSGRGRDCSVCANRQVLSGFNDFASNFPEVLEEWNYQRNSHLDPTKLAVNSRERVWWLGKCGHEWNSTITNRSTKARGCPECSLPGFTSTKPGILYFIHNRELLAFKVGITNKSSKTDRLKMFVGKGWRIIETWDNESGQVIQDTETKFFTWLRREMDIPRFLDRASVGSRQGASETFSDSILTKAEVIAKIEELLAQAEQ